MENGSNGSGSQQDDLFYSPSKGQLTLEKVISEIANFINEDSTHFYRLVIGTDSQAKGLNGEAEVDFVTAIVIHRAGRGGRYFWRKVRQKSKLVLRERIYRETLLSLELAEKFVPAVRKVIPPSKYDLEIHIDVGPIGPTREMIREVVGMVNGSGFTAKTKPLSWGAFVVADKYT
ncbi:ribonuclease H-like YkuK family protein [Candidatus Microgenomates bacterium]|nr:ribonuclease H-like YkuK family protein [Candidatus Microgenomates bacterium]